MFYFYIHDDMEIITKMQQNRSIIIIINNTPLPGTRVLFQINNTEFDFYGAH